MVLGLVAEDLVEGGDVVVKVVVEIHRDRVLVVLPAGSQAGPGGRADWGPDKGPGEAHLGPRCVGQ